MVLAAFITTCFVVGGVSAIYLLRDRHREGATLMLKLATVFACITVPLHKFSSATYTASSCATTNP